VGKEEETGGMKVWGPKGMATCDACDENTPEIHVVLFEKTQQVRLLCPACLEWTRELLAMIDVKESEV